MSQYSMLYIASLVTWVIATQSFATSGTIRIRDPKAHIATTIINSQMVNIFSGQVGKLWTPRRNRIVAGSSFQSNSTKFRVLWFADSTIAIQHAQHNKFLCINKRGKAQLRWSFNRNRCTFVQARHIFSYLRLAARPCFLVATKYRPVLQCRRPGRSAYPKGSALLFMA